MYIPLHYSGILRADAVEAAEAQAAAAAAHADKDATSSSDNDDSDDDSGEESEQTPKQQQEHNHHASESTLEDLDTVLKRFDAHLQGIYDGLPRNSLLLVATGSGDSATVCIVDIDTHTALHMYTSQHILCNNTTGPEAAQKVQVPLRHMDSDGPTAAGAV